MNESKSRLVIEISSENAKRNTQALASELEKLTSSGDKSEKSMNDLSKELKSTGSASQSLDKDINKNTVSLSRNAVATDKTSDSVRQLAIYMRNTLIASTAMAGGIGGVTSILSQAATDIERYSKLTQMSTDDFQYYALGAKKAGISMDEYAQALKDVFDRLGDVTDAQSGEMMDFFENIAPKVGLTTDAFKGLSGQDALQLYYNSLVKLNLPHAEMIKYMEQLVNDGSLLIPVLENNGEGFKKVGDAAVQANAIMSGELIAGLNATKAEFGNLQLQSMGLVYSFTGSMLPAVKLVSENFDTLVAVGGVIAALYGGRVAAAFGASAIAISKDTIATLANNSAKATALTVGRSLLGVLGGPVGLAVSIGTVAASYLLLKKNTDQSTTSLMANNATVKEAIEKYAELDTVKKRQQLSSEKAVLDDTAEGFKNLTEKLTANAYSLTRHNDVTKEQAKSLNAVISEFKKTGDLDTFSSKINALNFINQESKDKFNLLAGGVKDAGNEFSNQKQFVDAINGSLNSTAQAGYNAANGINSAATALSEYAKQAKDAGRKAEITNGLLAKGYSQGVATDLAEIAAKNGKVTAQEAEAIIYKNKQVDALNKTLEQQRKQQQSTTKSGKSYENQLKSSRREAERLQEQQYQAREQIVYENAHRERQIELDLAKEIAEIRKAGFGAADTKGLIDNAETRAKYEKELYNEQLVYQLNEWQWSESERLDQSVKINRLMILSNREMTDENKQYALDSMIDQSNHELALIELAKEERIFQIQQGLMHANDQSQKYWDLERQRIALSTQDLAERNRQLAIANELQAEEKRSNLYNAVQQWGRTQADMTGTGEQFQLEQTKQDRFGESQGLFDAQMALAETAEQREAIWQAHHERMSVIEADYQARSIGLQASQAAQFAGIMQGMVSESSTAYAALGAIQKGAALFSTAMNSYTAISAAWASAPFPYNLPAVGMATLETGLLQSAVSALSPQGYANGGYTGAGGKYDVAGLVHKGEVVFSQDDVKRNGGVAAVEAMRLSRDSNRVGNGQLNAINNGGAIQAKQQAQANAQQPQQSSPQLNQVINNVVNWDDVPSVMAGQAGQKVTLNIIKKNRTQIKAMLA